MLDRYLEGLVKQANKQERTLSDLDMDDLAKLAGIPMSSSSCPKCGDAMTKVAGYLRCQCGVLKQAGIEEEALGAPGGGVPLQVVHRTSLAPITAGEAIGERKGRRVGSIAGTGLGGLGGAALGGVIGARSGGGGLRSALLAGGGGLAGLLAGAGVGSYVGRGIGGSVGQAIGGGFSPTTKEASATGMDLLAVGDAAGRILAKMAAAPEIEGVPVDELKESVEEAKAREDVPGRAKRWGIGGGIGGGLAGGAAGYGLGHLLTRGRTGGALPWAARLGGAALGGAGGGALGGFLGHRHGAQEAQADQLLEAIRARSAFGSGAQEGYQTGEQSGYMNALDEMNQGGSPFQGR